MSLSGEPTNEELETGCLDPDSDPDLDNADGQREILGLDFEDEIPDATTDEEFARAYEEWRADEDSRR